MWKTPEAVMVQRLYNCYTLGTGRLRHDSPGEGAKGFKRITLKAGGKQRVSFRIDREMLSYYDRTHRWQCEPGTFTIAVGASSIDNTKVSLELK